MPASSSRLPLAAVILLLPAATALLLSLSCCPAAAANYSGGVGGRAVADAGGAAPVDSEWRQRRRLLEDEVAPELGGMLAQGAGQGYISYNTLHNNGQACGGGGCAARGASYTQKCTYANWCRG